MDSILLVPILTPSTRYSEWKSKMIAYLKRKVSMGLGKQSYEYEKNWINDGDRAYGAICGTFSRILLIYLIEFAEYPKDLWIELDRIFGKHNEDCYRNMGRTFRTTRVLYSKFSASTLFDEFVQDEEEAKSSHSQFKLKKVSLE